MHQLDWAGELASTKVDNNGEEVKTAQVVTWRQLEPALPPPGKVGMCESRRLVGGLGTGLQGRSQQNLVARGLSGLTSCHSHKCGPRAKGLA